MKVYRQLVRTFMRSGEMEEPKQKKQKLFYVLLGAIAVLFVMIPCCLLVGYITYGFTLGLSGSAAGFLLMVHFVSLFSIVFGIHVILNVFYYAGDIPAILPLPIAPRTLIAAKFTAAYWNETVMQMLLLISAFIGFFAAAQEKWWMYPVAIAGILTLPLAPLLYCGVICIVMMAFVRRMRNKNTARKLSMCIVLVVMVLAVMGLGLLNGIDLQNFTQQLADSKVTFVNVMNYLFPTNWLFIKAMQSQQIGWFLLYLLANAAGIAIFLWLAQKWYMRGVLGMLEAQTGSRKVRHQKKRKKAAKPWVAYLKKEWKVLWRTPAFFTNCLIINALWPILLYVIYIMQKDSQLLQEYYLSYTLGNEGIQWLTTLFLLVFTVLVTAANSIASTGITREGRNYTFMKQIPVSYPVQLNVKAGISIIVSGGVMLIYIIALSVFLEIRNEVAWFYIVISLLEVIFITYFGLYLDTINPKLFWDDELNALRGNANVFFNMAYAMIISAIFTVAMVLFYYFTQIPLRAMEVILMFVLIVADAIMYRICITKGQKNVELL